MAAPRPFYFDGEVFGGTAQERAAAAAGNVAYAVTYGVVEGNIVEHRVELRLFPNGIGTTGARAASIDGRVVALTPVDPVVVKGVAEGVLLEWERV